MFKSGKRITVVRPEKICGKIDIALILEHCFIIPNYNGASFISKTLIQAINSKSGDIIVVDDKSTDSSINIIENYPVTLIKRGENKGFAAAVNSGLKEAQARGYKFVSIMNSDVELNCDFLKILQSVTQILNMQYENAVVGYQEQGTDRLFEGDAISGFFFTIKLNVIDVIGYMNEDFYMYGEETEFFRRVLNKNFKIIQSGFTVQHLGEKSSATSIDTSWYSIRNSIFLELLHGRYMFAVRTVLVLFLTINHLYRPEGAKSDPSYKRIKKPGLIKGNLYLIKAIAWNIKRLFQNSER